MRWLTLATVIAAAGSFAVLLLSAWTLGTAVNLQFAAYWGLFFACTGVLGGLMQETTRAVGAAGRATAAHPGRTAPAGRGARPILVAAAVAAVTAAAFGLTGPIWLPLVVDEHLGAAVALLALGLGSYAMQAAVSGLLAAAGLWGQYAALIIIDILVRVALAAVAFQRGWGLLAFLVITVIGAASWLPLAAASPATRAALGARADVRPRRFTALMATAMLASGASALLVTGFATLVKLADDLGAGGTGPLGAPDPAVAAVTAAGIAYAVSLTRAPLLIPLEKFQNAIIVHFVRAGGAPLAALARPLAALVAFGVAGACLAWPVGPWLLRVLPGDYMIPGAGLFALTLGATSTAVLMVTGSVMLATSHHRAYLAGWVLATAVACALLLAPGALLWRTAAAVIAAPLLGVALHLRILAGEATCPAG